MKTPTRIPHLTRYGVWCVALAITLTNSTSFSHADTWGCGQMAYPVSGPTVREPDVSGCPASCWVIHADLGDTVCMVPLSPDPCVFCKETNSYGNRCTLPRSGMKYPGACVQQVGKWSCVRIPDAEGFSVQTFVYEPCDSGWDCERCPEE